MKTRPRISITIVPAPMEDVGTAEFEQEAQKLLQIHWSAQDILETLKATVFMTESMMKTHGIEPASYIHMHNAKQFLARFE